MRFVCTAKGSINMIDFEQWYEKEGYGLAFGSNEYSDCYFGARESWNYQQAKIDQLNKKNSEEKRILHNVIEMNQAKIDELQARIRIYEKHVKAIKHIHETQFDKNTDTSFILGNLDGFIEYLESDLKGNKDEN